MKRVIMLGNYVHTGGALEVFRNIAKHSRKCGWEPHYVAHGILGGGGNIPDMSMFASCEVIELKDRDNVDEVENYTKRLSAYLNEFDLCHSSLVPQDWRHRLKSKLTIPQVETYHSSDGWARSWAQYQYRLKYGVENPVTMVAVSNGLANRMKDDLKAQGVSGDVRMIYNGVDIPEKMAAGGPYVTYVGRISNDKGLDTWIKVAHQVRRLCPDSKFQWVGGLSPQYHPFLFELLKAALPWVEFVGHQTDPSPYYERACCLMLTSPSEGLPMTILEAQVRGIPAIAFDNGDTNETGCRLCQSSEEMAKYVSVYAERFPVEVSEITDWTRNNFGIMHMSDEYCRLYGEVHERDSNRPMPQESAIS